MSKMLAATIDTDGAVVTVDLEVVDVSSGLLEASERVQGPQEKFMELQTQLAVAALRALGVEPTADQMQEIVASRGNETLDAYRLLSDTLGKPVKKREAPKPPPAGRARAGDVPLRMARARVRRGARRGRRRDPCPAPPVRRGPRGEARRPARRPPGRDGHGAARLAAALLRHRAR